VCVSGDRYRPRPCRLTTVGRDRVGDRSVAARGGAGSESDPRAVDGRRPLAAGRSCDRDAAGTAVLAEVLAGWRDGHGADRRRFDRRLLAARSRPNTKSCEQCGQHDDVRCRQAHDNPRRHVEQLAGRVARRSRGPSSGGLVAWRAGGSRTIAYSFARSGGSRSQACGRGGAHPCRALPDAPSLGVRPRAEAEAT